MAKVAEYPDFRGKFPFDCRNLCSHIWVWREVEPKDLHLVHWFDNWSIFSEEMGRRCVKVCSRDYHELSLEVVDLHSSRLGFGDDPPKEVLIPLNVFIFASMPVPFHIPLCVIYYTGPWHCSLTIFLSIFSFYCWVVLYLYMIFRAFSSIWENIRGIQWLQGCKIHNFKKAPKPKNYLFFLLYKNNFYLGFDKKTRHAPWKQHDILMFFKELWPLLSFLCTFSLVYLSVQLNLMIAISLKINMIEPLLVWWTWNNVTNAYFGQFLQ